MHNLTKEKKKEKLLPFRERCLRSLRLHERTFIFTLFSPHSTSQFHLEKSATVAPLTATPHHHARSSGPTQTMGFIIQDYNLQEYMSMVFYCIVGMGVIFHWVHVWVGRPDSRMKAIERRMRWLEEGEYRYREVHYTTSCALLQYGIAHFAPQPKPLPGMSYPPTDPSGRRDSGCYASASMPPQAAGPGSIFSNINDGPSSLFHAPPMSQRHCSDSYFNTPCCSESIAPHEVPVAPSVCNNSRAYHTSSCSPMPPPTPGTPYQRRR